LSEDAKRSRVVRSRFAPGKRLAWSTLAATPLALGGLAGASIVGAWDALLVGSAWVESYALKKRAPNVERSFDGRMTVGVKNRVTLQIHNPSSSALRLTIRDDIPAGWRAVPDEVSVIVPAFARREAHYEVIPHERGDHVFGDLHVRTDGIFGLGARLLTIASERNVRVYPNVLGAGGQDLASRLGDLRSIGFRNVRRSGGGGEFDQLREYVQGDAFRDLDWKSSAKRLRPVTRVMRDERSQNVLLALDVGRLMAIRLTEGDTATTKLDHTIRAALLLAWVALRHGDRVGLILFAEDVHKFVPANRGPGQYRVLLEALYAVKANSAYVDFRRFVEFLRIRVPRRSLVVMFSDLLDDTHALPLAEHLAGIRNKHLPVCVTMQDAIAERLAASTVSSREQAYERAAAADLLNDRDNVKAHLRRSGVGLVEAPVGSLAVDTVNRYLEIKARNLL
jgi:uncharacterized protein (DUF58 family)